MQGWKSKAHGVVARGLNCSPRAGENVPVCMKTPVLTNATWTQPKTMDQTETALNIGEVIDALGITLPVVDETPAATNEEPAKEIEASEEAVADGDTENTDNEETGNEPDAAETEVAADDEAAEDAEDADSAEDDPDNAEEVPAVKKLAKRVDKLTARAKSAEEQAASLQAELAAAKDALTRAQPIVVQDTADPLADVTSAEALEARLTAANTVLDNVPDLIARADMEGGEIEIAMGDGSTRRFTKQELQERLRVARQILKAEPARRNYLAQRETYQQEARAVYPELFQDGHGARQMMLETLRAYPGIAKLPNLELIIGDAIRGQALRFQQAEALQKKSAKAAKPAAASSAKPAAVAPKVVNPSAAPKTKTQADPLAVLKKSGSRDAAESFVASLFT